MNSKVMGHFAPSMNKESRYDTRMKSQEFQNFSNAMDRLLKVSHDELKAQLDAEKRAKKKKRKSKEPSASDRAASDKD